MIATVTVYITSSHHHPLYAAITITVTRLVAFVPAIFILAICDLGQTKPSSEMLARPLTKVVKLDLPTVRARFPP